VAKRDKPRQTRSDIVWLADSVTIPRTHIRIVGYDAAIGLPEWLAELSAAIGDTDGTL